MSTAKFRQQITTFRQSLQYFRTGASKYAAEDQLLIDLIRNVDFIVLYASKEFRESLDKRMEIKRLHKLIQYERYR